MSPSLPLPAETRRRLDEHDRRWPFKFGLRAVATLFAFIAMVIFAATISESKKNYGGNDWVDGMPLAPVLLALFYNPLVIFLTLYYRQGRPLHPGWHVGVDLFVWALAVPSIVFSVGDGWFWYWQPVLLEFDGIIPCDAFNYWSYQCNPLIYTLGKMEIAANVFLALILFIHFALFVFACIATHRWRKAKKIAATERRNIELTYHRSPAQHKEQQPPAYTPSAKGSHSAGDHDENPFQGSGHRAGPSESENYWKDAERGAVKYV
ncbi:hypothetical protein N7G274_002672 [Stereocaulon virgatum]|uniref:MARVEL domain-containing protein n=1 Tax=Stereocaulon virgatum TaxID=373712 RepID=A0ABR4AJQ5_9LECA